MKKFITAFIISVLAACQSEEIRKADVSADYIVFGHYYGMCIGESCVEIYKLTDNNLYEDITDQYPASNDSYIGNFRLLNNSKFEKVKELKNSVPQELLSVNQTIIGMPDAGDWGGIYFEMSVNGEKAFWLIDKMEENIPDYLRPFVNEIEAKIDLINN